MYELMYMFHNDESEHEEYQTFEQNKPTPAFVYKISLSLKRFKHTTNNNLNFIQPTSMTSFSINK